MDFIYQRMEDDIEINPDNTSKSQIAEFYSGKTIFLTGCTGFIGKCLVEKILRTCWDIKRLYILVRIKKYESIEKRIDEYFNNVIFDTLRSLRPNFREKITIIAGDLSAPGIAISPEDRRLLTETVDVIIHNASMVIFSAKISTILRINVLGTKEMLDLAVECRNLKCFMYISTAFSHCYLLTIDEKFYNPPADLKIVHDIIKADTETEAGLSKKVLESFLGSYPNAYIFTKAIAESIVQDYAKSVSFPCGVFRMSIAISTYKEPIKGWCGNSNGPTFLFVAASLGLLHVMYFAEDGVPDMVPADMVSNACWVTVWDLAENKKNCKKGCVYNYGNSTANPVSYKMLREKLMYQCTECPSIKLVSVVSVAMVHDYYSFLAYHILFHYIPAVIVDIFRLMQRKRPKYIPMLLRIEKHMKEIIYFSTRNWTIKLGEISRIWEIMNPADHRLFFCDLRKIDWDEYTLPYWYGLRVYLLNEPLDNLKAAKRRLRIIYSATYISLFLIMLLILYFVFSRFA